MGLSKIVILGSGGVGKTCIANRLITGSYIDSKMTIGLDIESWGLVDNESGETFKIVTYDLGGQPQFRFFQGPMISGATLGIVVFDLSRYQSIDEISEWVSMLNSIPLILVANKMDLDQEVSDDEIQTIAEQYNTPVIRLSAKSGKNIEELENAIMKLIRNEYQLSESSQSLSVKTEEE
ncbi:MAG: Rab family GTPase [Candidatus Thorarchaeota archaeon]